MPDRDDAAVAIHWLGADGTILWANEAELSLLGYASAEYVGRRVAAFHADPDVALDLLARLARNEPLNAYEARLRRKDGRILHVLIDSSPHSGNGISFHTTCFTVDVSERRLAERRLLVEHGLARVLSEAPSLEEAGPAILSALVRGLDWESGVLWIVDGESPLLLRAHVVPSPNAAAADERTEELALRRGEGLPGRAWASEQPVWLGDARGEPGLPGRSQDDDAPLEALALPVKRGGRVVAVVEFAGRGLAPPEPALQNMLTAGAAQLGQFLDRRAAEVELSRLLEREKQAHADAEGAWRRAFFLAEAGHVLASSLDYVTTLGTLAKLAVPYLAEWCAVDLADDGALKRVAVYHADPEKLQITQRLLERRDPPHPLRWIGKVLRSGKAELFADVDETFLESIASDAEQLQALRALGIQSAMVVPLLARQRTLGAISFVSGASGPRYGPAELLLAEELARRAALAVDNARLYEQAQAALRERDRASGEATLRARQQAAVAWLGQRALRGCGLAELRDEAASLVTSTLGVDFVEILELLPGGQALVLREGRGFAEALIGNAQVGAGQASHAGLAISAHQPVILEDLRSETRFEAPLLARHGVVSGVAVVIQGSERPFGVLGAHSSRPRSFTRDDISFLQSLANVLAAVLERDRASAQLQLREERFRALVERSTDAIALLDCVGVIRYAGPSTPRVLGYEPADCLGQLVFAWIHPDDVPAVQHAVFGLLEQKGRSAGVQFRARHKDSSWRWIEGSITNLLGEESVEALVLNYRDITERKHAEQKIQHQAYHDPLTSLPNRLLFQDRLGLGIAHAQRSGKKLAVMYADLDRFKWINDTLGHAAGDRLLVAVAERLRGCLRDDDTVARVGGDEFTLLLPDLNRADDAAKLASKLVEAVARPFDIDGGQIHVTVSIGVSVHPDDGTDAESLLKGADNALYRAKEAGRNNAQLCTPALNARARHRMELERALRQALERAELLLHYQPQFEARTRRLVGAEALLRWNHPQAGLLYPDDFIPVAEDSRLIVPIGEWALRAACRQARQWHDRRSDLAIAVNLSGRQFERAGLRAVVDSALEDSGLDPARLELEITESVALREASAASTLLERLRARGVRVAIDDFGTGHSSLQSLQRLPIDALKIDRAFVKNLGLGQNGQAIVRAIIAMAHSMRLRVVAEGVETESQLRFLERERCEELQGYLLGRPLPAEQFERLLDAAPAPRAN